MLIPLKERILIFHLVMIALFGADLTEDFVRIPISALDKKVPRQAILGDLMEPIMVSSDV